MNQISMVILKDSSECGDGTNSCEQLCDSRPGTYACRCHGFGGYELSSNGFACIKEKFIIILLLTLGACAKGTVVVLCVGMPVTTLAATYLVYTLKRRYH